MRPRREGGRTLSADPAALSRDGRTGTRRKRRRRHPLTAVCRHNLSGRSPPPRARAASPERVARARARGRCDRTANRSRGRSRARRSGRVSGIRPSDRRGPGPVGHRGRNVRSTGRCSYNLRITRGRADSCGLHRSTSQVIRRSGSGVFVFFFSFSVRNTTIFRNTTVTGGCRGARTIARARRARRPRAAATVRIVRGGPVNL